MGVRLSSELPKALVNLAGTPMLVRTLGCFSSFSFLSPTVVVIPAGHEVAFETLLGKAFPEDDFLCVAGGTERQHSVGNGLACLRKDAEIVVVHDAARPFVSPDAIQSALEAAASHDGATVAIPCIDTILESSIDHMVLRTPDRGSLWACQTPQVFHAGMLADLHRAARRDGPLFTDDASLVRHYGGTVKLVEGNSLNLKITTPEDLILAESILAAE
jgi:2-C-methyl-D-erythritol 4-phosphate cytidylyltransferase